MSATDRARLSRTRNDARSSIACDRCRQKRKRCDGGHPICGTCSATKSACQWPERKKRGRRVDLGGLHDGIQQVELASGSGTGVLLRPHRSSLRRTASIVGGTTPTIATDGAGDFSSQPPTHVGSNTGIPISGGGEAGPHIRFYGGTTALQPGLQRVRVRPNVALPVPLGSEDMLIGRRIDTAPLVDATTGLPSTVYFRPLLGAFFANFGQFHPSIQRCRIEEAIRDRKISVFLALGLAAIAAQFVQTNDLPAGAGDVYFDMAKKMTIDAISIPDISVCEGCLLLAWCSFSRNEESLCWQYFGMGARIALDLGFHRAADPSSMSNINGDRGQMSDIQAQSLCFWTVVMMDRFLTLIKGMHITIPEKPIEIPLPEAADLPLTNMDGESGHVSPFPQVVQLMIHAGRIANALNQPARDPCLIRSLQNELLTYHQSFPASQAWSVDNFATHAKAHQSGAFLLLHLWPYATLALLQDQDDRGLSFSGIETPNTFSLTCARTICDRFVTADLTDPEAYLGTIYLIQPLFIASKILLAEIMANRHLSHEDPLQNLSILIARQNLDIMISGLRKMATRWGGVEPSLTTLHDLAALAGVSDLFDISRTSAAAFPTPGQAPSIWNSGHDQSIQSHHSTQDRDYEAPWLIAPAESDPAVATFLNGIRIEDSDPWTLDFSSIFGLMGNVESE